MTCPHLSSQWDGQDTQCPLTAASIAALTIYDMCKAVQKDMLIEGVRLLHKSGGKSGAYEAPAE